MEVIIHDDEMPILRDALRQYVSELRVETVKTENFEWRRAQKHDEAILKNLIARLDQAVDDATAAPVTALRAVEPGET